MQKRFRSAVDAWLVVLLVVIPVGILVLAASKFPTEPGKAIFVAMQAVVFCGLVAAFAVPCIYTLHDDHLHIRCGLIESTIPLRNITHVEPSRNVLSAPALSLRRVKIVHRDGYALVSPKARDEFIAELQLAATRARQRAA